MNSKLLKKTLEVERKSRQKLKEEIEKNNIEQDSIKDFSWVRFFAGEEFNQELTKNQNILPKNIIDFSQVGNKGGEFIKNKLKEIIDAAENKQSISEKKFPIIWFKDLEKINSGSAMEKALLPVFDPQQNTKLFSENLDLSEYILIATNPTRDMSKLSPPLASRLDCVNVETAQPKQFFLDKYFSFLLVGTVFSIVILLVYLFWPKRSKVVEE